MYFDQVKVNTKGKKKKSKDIQSADTRPDLSSTLDLSPPHTAQPRILMSAPARVHHHDGELLNGDGTGKC